MGVKNNFSQAVSELIGISRVTEPDQDPVQEEAELIDHNAEMEAVAVDLDLEGSVSEDKSSAKEADELAPIQQEISPAPQSPPNPYKERVLAVLTQQPKPAPGLTTIARGTVFIGEINAEGDVELLGSVKGKISSQGDIKANGKVIGDLIGKDIELIACAVQGNIVASGLVTVDGDSVVIGDVKSENFCLDGKIKGNVTAEKEAKFQPKAILAGNVTTASIAMSQGAKIQGAVNIPLSEKETNMSFDVDIVI